MSIVAVPGTTDRLTLPGDGPLIMRRRGAAFMLAVSLHLVALLAVPAFHFSDARMPAVHEISVHMFRSTPAPSATVPPGTQSRAKDIRPGAATAEPMPMPMPESAATTTADGHTSGGNLPIDSATSVPAALPITAAHVDTRYLDNPAPSYPPMSRRLGETGLVILLVQVNAQGAVLDAVIDQSSGYPRLDAAARAAVMKWRFVPARRGDETTGSHVRVPVRFGLES